jgi:hypothetical protein
MQQPLLGAFCLYVGLAATAHADHAGHVVIAAHFAAHHFGAHQFAGRAAGHAGRAAVCV